jgi:hypothetical protein
VKELKTFVIGIVAVVFVLQIVNGQGDAMVAGAVGLLGSIAVHLQVLMVAVALPVLLIGAALYISPWHRDLAGRLVVGALVVLVVAVLGPAFIGWFQAQVGAYGGRLLGGHP